MKEEQYEEMSQEERDKLYQARKRLLRNNTEVVCVDLEHGSERLMMSPYPNARKEENHETVVEAALWVRQDRPKHSSKYKTYIRRSLDSAINNRSMVNDGAYCDTYDEAVAWLEEKAQEFDGDPLNWKERDRMVIDEEEIIEDLDGVQEP